MLKCLYEGKTQSETTRLIIELGCDYGFRYIRQYIHSLVTQYQIEINRYISSTHNRKNSQNSKTIYITRKGIFQYLWLNGELTTEHHEYASFVNGLEKDISAVENAVASQLSNGFVEGTNSKLKMIKRTMYGQCDPKLWSAKLMYTPV